MRLFMAPEVRTGRGPARPRGFRLIIAVLLGMTTAGAAAAQTPPAETDLPSVQAGTDDRVVKLVAAIEKLAGSMTARDQAYQQKFAELHKEVQHVKGQLGSLQKAIVEGPQTHVVASSPGKSNGNAVKPAKWSQAATIKLLNEYAGDVLLTVNDQVVPLLPGETVLVQVPAGRFRYTLAQPGRGLLQMRESYIGSGELTTLVVR